LTQISIATTVDGRLQFLQDAVDFGGQSWPIITTCSDCGHSSLTGSDYDLYREVTLEVQS
jgi:hypothetical protein